jgi:threonine synthase
MASFVTHLACARCATRHDHRTPRNRCHCGGPLFVEYDLEAVARSVDRDDFAQRSPTMWRYRELLPVENSRNVITLGEGFTPLIAVPELGRRIGLPDLWVKDDGVNPTGTFKARGASCGITLARELGIREVALPTAGNAGGAWACYGAAANIRVHVAMPSDAPWINQLECRMFGADLTLVDGTISDAAAAVARGVAKNGWFEVSTLKEPFRIEGKKTLVYEIAEQMRWRIPDAIVCPVGGGVAIIGVWRALAQLRRVGWIEDRSPRLIAVQSDGCAPIVRAFEEGRPESKPWPEASTIAAGLRVPDPVGGFLVLRAVRETGGTAVAVSDEDIAAAMWSLARDAGIAAAPEGAATLAAAIRLREQGRLEPDSRVVLLNTGTAFKYPDAIAAGRVAERSTESYP